MAVFRSDDRYIYLDDPYCEFYIPMDYFKNGWAVEKMETVESIGLFNVGLFNDDKFKEMKILNLPTVTNFYKYVSEQRTIDFLGSPQTPCMVLKYIRGQKIMESSTIEDSTNSETYLDIIAKGKNPSTIPYSKALKIWSKNQESNSVHFGVPSSTMEMFLAVSYRDKNNLEKKFATVIGRDPKVSEFDYKTASIRQICQYASTFTAMTFEDINSMITTSVNRTRDNKYEMESPVEKIIKF